MKKKLRCYALRRIALYLGIAGMIFYANPTYADHTFSGASNSCSLTGISSHYPAPGVFVIDDGYSNFAHGSNGRGNCDRRFIFTEYTGAASNIALSFAYDGVNRQHKVD